MSTEEVVTPGPRRDWDPLPHMPSGFWAGRAKLREEMAAECRDSDSRDLRAAAKDHADEAARLWAICEHRKRGGGPCA